MNPPSIHGLHTNHIPMMVEGFARSHWTIKPASLFEHYLEQQERGERMVWVAMTPNDQFAGYVTLKWQSDYEPFATARIPEIMDLNVLPTFRNAGIGSALLDRAEAMARSRSATVGIGVGLYGGPDGGYGAAQRLYAQRGYVPDGKGVTYRTQLAQPGISYPLDDDLILWLTKPLA